MGRVFWPIGVGFQKKRRNVTCWCVMLCVAISESSGGRRSVSVSTNGAKDLGKGKHLVVPSVVPTKASGFCINQHQFADAKLAEVVAGWILYPSRSRLTSSTSFNVTEVRHESSSSTTIGPQSPIKSACPRTRASPLNGTPRVRKELLTPVAFRSLFGLSAARGVVDALRLRHRLERHSEPAT